MSTLIAEPVLGLEQIQRAILFMLQDNLNDAYGQVNDWMAASDELVAARYGNSYVPTTIEPIEVANFYEGHRPSLIKASIDKYPNCAAWGVRAQPTGDSSQLDQLAIFRDLIYIEIMVKSNDDEEEVNRRMHRLVEAVNICVLSNQSLNGVVHGLDLDPLVNISDVFTRKERTSYGPEWFWQGARLEYAVRKEAVYPSSSPAGSLLRTPHSTSIRRKGRRKDPAWLTITGSCGRQTPENWSTEVVLRKRQRRQYDQEHQGR